MNWFDIIAVLLILLITWLESVRGFGRAVFDLVGALISLRVAIALAPSLATAVPLLQSDAGSEALWMAASFVLLMVLVIIATKYIYETTLLSLDVLDPLVGGVLGFVSGIVIAHTFLRVMLTAYANTDFGTTLLNSFAGQELVVFRSYHYVVTKLQNIGEW